MAQRRMPSGQGPARRPVPAGRPGGRSSVRGAGQRAEPAAGSRIPASGRGTEALRTAAARSAANRSAANQSAGVRSGSRPAAARRTAGTGATKRTVAARPRAFTGRATILLFVLVILALGYTYPVRLYLAQESQIGRMEAAQAAQRAVIADRIEEVAKWKDPAYIRTQARKRLFYADRGETLLVVIPGADGAGRDPRHPSGSPADPDKWYDTLFSSVAAANAETRR